MITPKVSENKVVFGPCRLSYVHVFEKYTQEGDSGDGKYSTAVLIPKEEKETLKAIEQAVEAAKKAAVLSRWGGKVPKKLEMPLRDGDEKENAGEEYRNCFYLNAKSGSRPGVCDRNKVPITDEEEMYSGVWAYVSVVFYGYDVSGNRGVACGLNHLMKFKDDERFGGRSSAEEDFAGIDCEDDDDL
ncbi:MAG: DUF2815 family protein [Alloprevotella sp.]